MQMAKTLGDWCAHWLLLSAAGLTGCVSTAKTQVVETPWVERPVLSSEAATPLTIRWEQSGDELQGVAEPAVACLLEGSRTVTTEFVEKSDYRTLGYGLGGSGLVVSSVSGVYVHARNLLGDDCVAGCTPEQNRREGEHRSLDAAALVALAAGGTALLVGMYLVARGPRSRSTTLEQREEQRLGAVPIACLPPAALKGIEVGLVQDKAVLAHGTLDASGHVQLTAAEPLPQGTELSVVVVAAPNPKARRVLPRGQVLGKLTLPIGAPPTEALAP